MAVQAQSWTRPSRRRAPRFQMQTPIDVTVLRSGIPDTLPGRAVNVCERGIAGVLAGELVPGDTVGVELWLPQAANPLRTRAVVRYQDRLRCGLEFIGFSPEQRMAIRDWAKSAQADGESDIAPGFEIVTSAEVETNSGEKTKQGGEAVTAVGGTSRAGKTKRSRRGWMVFLVLLAAAAVGLWWNWDRGWEELESGLSLSDPAPTDKPQAQVAAEVMQKLLIHRVQPEYPAAARQAGTEGVVALDVIVGRDGSVLSVKPLNGPDVLARAAVDALRWWKFAPYRVNGEAVIVETTMAVEFKR